MNFKGKKWDFQCAFTTNFDLQRFCGHFGCLLPPFVILNRNPFCEPKAHEKPPDSTMRMQNLVQVNGSEHYALTQCLSLTKSLIMRHTSIRRSHTSLTMPSISLPAPLTMPNARRKKNANIFIRLEFLSLKVTKSFRDSQAFHGLSASSSPHRHPSLHLFPLMQKYWFSERLKF